jgi:WD40 repeat protein
MISPFPRLGNILPLQGCDSGTIRMWNVTTGTCLHTMDATGPVSFVEFSGNGRSLLTGEAGQIRLRSTGEFVLGLVM